MPHRLFTLLIFCALITASGSQNALAQLVLPGAIATGAQDGTPPAAGAHISGKSILPETVLAHPLHLNGVNGTITLTKTGDTLSLSQLILPGHMISRPGDPCQVEVLAKSTLPLVAAGQPDGVLRYDSKIPACSFSLDLLQGAVVLTPATHQCSFTAADCTARPDGMWGPSPAAISATQIQADIHARTLAETALRMSFRTLLDRQKDPATIRAIASEQAAFSSQREEMCRDYAREDQHGFCAARFTEGKLAQINQRLSLKKAPEPAASPHKKPVQNPAVPAEFAPLQLN